MSAIAAAALSSIAIWASRSHAQPNTWSVDIVDTAPVTELRKVGDDAFVRAGAWYIVEPCADSICITRRRPPNPVTARDGIPDGTVITASGSGIVQAWYAAPTTRYDHAVLGDNIEGGSLVVVDDAGLRHEIVLPANQVFEDLTPRIADIDGDGRNDVVTIRSGIATGSAIAIYSVADGVLVEVASIPEIGLAHRWLNVAGIGDFTGDGVTDIALVKTPHIGGRLEIWAMAAGELVRVATADGFSNHAIGSTELGMSAIVDVDGDGIVDIAVPNAQHSALRIVAVAGGVIREIAMAPLPSPVATAIAVITSADGIAFVAGLEDGSLATIGRRR